MSSSKRWGRRVGASLGWAVLNYSVIYFQPLLNLNADLITLVIEKSTWIAGLLIFGLSGTDAMKYYLNNKGK